VDRRHINPLNHKSDAVVHNGLVFVSGITPKNTSADVQGQTREVLQKIEEILHEAGSDRSKLLSANIWLADVADYAAVNKVWNAWVVEGKQPARACVGATLALPGILVEIAVVAAQ
jgi:enamine deaminase RidA (YjgF/YER057c/UK114 family)